MSTRLRLLQYPMTDRKNEENLTSLPKLPDRDDSHGTVQNPVKWFCIRTRCGKDKPPASHTGEEDCPRSQSVPLRTTDHAMRLEKQDIEKLKQMHTIEEVIRSCGVPLRERGAGERLVTNCPLPHHEDSTPSFMVYRNSGTFRCFGCGAGGDIFDFLQSYYGWSFRQALLYLAGQEGASVRSLTQPPRSPARPYPANTQPIQLPDYRRIATLAVEQYQEALLRSPHILAYVNERAVSLETARRLHLGYSDGHSFLTRIHADPSLREEACAAGLLTSGGRERLAHRLVIPEMRGSAAVYLIGRIVPPRESRHKYLGITTSKRLLGYGEALRRLTQQERLVEGMLIVEGALDFVLAWQWQLPVCCVALLSTWASQLQLDEIVDLYEHMKDTPVLVFLDADGPGRDATPRLLSQLQRRGLPVFPLSPLAVKDIGELGKLPDGRMHLLSRLKEGLHGKTR